MPPLLRPLRRFRHRLGNRGYNLVVLAVLFTVMNIVVAKSLPVWSHTIQRDKEAELIFRGLQYAEAIRVFKTRFNRAPVKLKELVDVEPRSIRQLWNNPLAESAPGEPPTGAGWGLIFEGRPVNQGQPPKPEDSATGGNLFDNEDGEGKVEIGPIIGVYSKLGEQAIKTFCDKDSIPKWHFRADAFQAVQLTPDAAPTAAINAGQIGRPWPPGITPVVNPGGSGCGNQRQGARPPGGIGAGGGSGAAGGPPGAPPRGGGRS